MRHAGAMAVVLALSTGALAQEDAEGPGVVTAIQNRAFRPVHEIFVSVGVLPADPYYKGLTGSASYTIHFTDSFAWQVARGSYSYALRTSLRDQLERDFAVLPTAFTNTVQFYVGSDLMWTPFYGKLSVLNAGVIHGEMFLTLGGSFFRFTNTWRPGVQIGGGGRIFLSQAFSIRIDATNNVVIPLGGNAGILNVVSLNLGIALNIGVVE